MQNNAKLEVEREVTSVAYYHLSTVNNNSVWQVSSCTEVGVFTFHLTFNVDLCIVFWCVAQCGTKGGTCTTPVQHWCDTCVMLVPCLWEACATPVQHLCNTCATLVQHLCNTCATLVFGQTLGVTLDHDTIWHTMQDKIWHNVTHNSTKCDTQCKHTWDKMRYTTWHIIQHTVWHTLQNALQN